MILGNRHLLLSPVRRLLQLRARLDFVPVRLRSGWQPERGVRNPCKTPDSSKL